MLPRLAALFIGLALPALLVKHALSRRADVWGKAWGQELALAAPLFAPARPSASEEAALRESLAGFERAEIALAAAPPTPAETTGKPKRGKAAKPNQAKGVFVPAATVLRLANAQVMPRAAFVPALGARPAGLRLIGVSALGIGMRDGDVLTRVLGADVTSVAEVVQRVIAARNQRARMISGEFWRDGARWALSVEQPYIDQPPPVPSAR